MRIITDVKTHLAIIIGKTFFSFHQDFLPLETASGIKLRCLLALLSSKATQDTKAIVFICVPG